MDEQPGVAAPQERREGGTPHASRLAHGLIIATNVLQLLLILLFLVLMLLRLDGAPLMWAAVFAPLWASDFVTVVTSAHEIGRLIRPPTPEPVRRNLLITQLNRAKGTLCTAIFKYLVVRRLSDPTDQTPARIICMPFVVCAVIRLVLHSLKEKVPSPEPSSPPKRPGTPVNPLHIFVMLIAVRVDGLNTLSWAATFWPTWIVFVLLGVTLIAAGFLGIGIFITGEPREHGQRALFGICYGVLLTVSVSGFAFQLKLVQRLDGNTSVTNSAIIAPLMAAYTGVLLFYLAFTFILPRVVEYDLAAMSERMEEDDDQRDGVLEAVSSQLAPPFLVQQSSTLFQRVNSTMLQSFLTSASKADSKLTSSVSPERALAQAATPAAADVDLEAGAGRSGGGQPAPRAQLAAALDVADPLPALSEYEALQLELGAWLREHNHQQGCQAQARPRPSQAAAHGTQGSGAPPAEAAPADESERALAPARAMVLVPAALQVDVAGRELSSGSGTEMTPRPGGAQGAAAPPGPPAAVLPAAERATRSSWRVGRQPPPSPAAARAQAAGELAPAPADDVAEMGSRNPPMPVAAASAPHSAAVSAGPLTVPPEILSKLQRFVELKRQIATQIVSATLVDLNSLSGQPQQLSHLPLAAAKGAVALDGAAAEPPAAAVAAAAAAANTSSTRGAAALATEGAAGGSRGSGAAGAGVVSSTLGQVEVREVRLTAMADGKAQCAVAELDAAAEGEGLGAEAAAQAAPALARRSGDGDGDADDVHEDACWICCEGPRDAVSRARRTSACLPRLRAKEVCPARLHPLTSAPDAVSLPLAIRRLCRAGLPRVRPRRRLPGVCAPLLQEEGAAVPDVQAAH